MPTPPEAEWTFGDAGFAKIYGDRIARSSLLDTAVATRWAFLFMLSQADAEGRFRCATVSALARAAAITLAQARQAVRELEAPDPDSTTKTQEGRRIVPIAGGWQIVNLKAYRDYRSKKQQHAAERKARERVRKQERTRENAGAKRDMSRDVTRGHGQTLDVRRQTPDSTSTDLPAIAGGLEAQVWSRGACDDWILRFGGTAPGGQIGRALKPLVKVHGWLAVRAAWRSYLEQTGAEHASANRFASTFGHWAGQRGSAAAVSPLTAHNAKALGLR
jgi:hypothetical protein